MSNKKDDKKKVTKDKVIEEITQIVEKPKKNKKATKNDSKTDPKIDSSIEEEIKEPVKFKKIKVEKPKDYIIEDNPNQLEIEILGALSKEPSFLVNNFFRKGLKKYKSVESAVKAYKKLYNK